VQYAVDVQADYNPAGVAVADMNGDGKPDVIVGLDTHVAVLLNKGDGTFGAPIFSALFGAQHTMIAMADLNGDGKPDLVVNNYDWNTVSVLMNQGAGAFAPHVEYPTGTEPGAFALADLNGDGKIDIVLTIHNELSSSTHGSVDVLLNKGDGTFAPEVHYDVEDDPVSVAVADFDGDGKPDLAVANAVSETVSVLLNHGDGTFPTKVDYPTAEHDFILKDAVSVGAADLDGDGKPDIFIAHTSGDRHVLHNQGDGTFTAGGDLLNLMEPSVAATAADLNGDGKPDLLTTDRAGIVSVFLNQGGGSFAPKVDLLIDATLPVAVADLNGDGRLDLVSAGPVGNANVLLNTCQP
jgi:hypothetical protein